MAGGVKINTKTKKMMKVNNENRAYGGIFVVVSGQKDCDLSKSAIGSLHTTNAFGQVVNSGGNDGGGGPRIHVSSNVCDPHGMHQDQVSS